MPAGPMCPAGNDRRGSLSLPRRIPCCGPDGAAGGAIFGILVRAGLARAKPTLSAAHRKSRRLAPLRGAEGAEQVPRIGMIDGEGAASPSLRKGRAVSAPPRLVAAPGVPSLPRLTACAGRVIPLRARKPCGCAFTPPGFASGQKPMARDAFGFE